MVGLYLLICAMASPRNHHLLQKGYSQDIGPQSSLSVGRTAPASEPLLLHSALESHMFLLCYVRPVLDRNSPSPVAMLGTPACIWYTPHTLLGLCIDHGTSQAATWKICSLNPHRYDSFSRPGLDDRDRTWSLLTALDCVPSVTWIKSIHIPPVINSQLEVFRGIWLLDGIFGNAAAFQCPQPDMKVGLVSSIGMIASPHPSGSTTFCFGKRGRMHSR